MRFLASFLLFLLAAQPAAAATTVYATGVSSQSGVVSNLANGFGPANGAAADIGGAVTFFGFTIGQAGQVVYSFGQALSGAGLQLTGLGGGPGVPAVRISIGEIVGGVATFSTEVAFAGGAGIFNFDLSTQCSAISLTGCSLLRIRTLGGFGRGPFHLDGVSGVAAAPEPAAWALMLFGFAGVAWRLKRQRAAAPALVRING